MMSDAIEVLGWTLLHFVWQGAAVGVLAAALLIALRRCSANARYLTAVVALGLMLLMPLGTIAWIEQTPPVGDVSPIFNTVSMVEIPRTREDGTLALDEPPIKVERIGIDFENPPPADAVPLIPVSETGQTILEDLAEQRSGVGFESSLKPFIPWAVAAWLVGVGVLSLRLFASWLSVQRLRRRATQPASENWQVLLSRIAERLRVTRPVKLVESALVEVPTVIGWLKPIILLPASAMTGLTTEQLEALLAHELAHVRRHDYLVNLLQTVVETLLFYHPAVWWLSHRIRVEREHCCDDLAASVCGDRLSYAKALVAMEELRTPPLGLAMSARGGSLLSRVARLLRPTESQRQPVGWLAGLIVMLTLTLAGALGAGLLTPPDKPTKGLPNGASSTKAKSTDTTQESSGPNQRRGQETGAEHTSKLSVVKVLFEGNRKTKMEDLLKLAKITLGAPLNGREVRQATRAIYSTRDFYSVEPQCREVTDGVELVFRVIEREPIKQGRFAGRVRLKIDSEKPLPDLETVEVPAGKVLDESLVFSKEGGLANVFVSLWQPKFKIEPATEAELAKPFVLIADSGKFWPHAALVRVGRPVVFENRSVEPINFVTQPLRNSPFNVLVKREDRFKAPAFEKSENIPISVKSNIKPWMLAHLLPLDHPFAALTDDDGRFEINGLPPGEHEFRVWHERAGWLEKSLKITIQLGEEAKSELEYTPDRLKLTEADVLTWANRLIDAKWIPRAMAPRPAAPKKEDEANKEAATDQTTRDNLEQRVQVAQKAAAVAKAEYEKILVANHRVPGSIPDTEVERVKLAYEKALLVEARLAVERAVTFLKSQQQENGSWQGTPLDGVTALCAAALLQAGVKADDPVMQKALAYLRTIRPTLSYTVALQTMVFCMASSKDDAELIKRNVAWLEKAQATEGPNRGGWSYMENNTKIADGSCSRFAMLGLHAAKKAGFEVEVETWKNASDYYLSSKKAGSHVWGYTPEAGPTPTMTLAAMAGLAILNQHLPQDEQTQQRTEAIDRAVPYVESNAGILWNAGHGFYSLHGLERAARLNRWTKLGKHELSKLLDERLAGLQRPDGSWAYVGGGRGFFAVDGEQSKEQNEAAAAAAKLERQSNDFIATSFALMCLTGQPEPPRERQLRFEPREMGKLMQIRTNPIENSSPPMQRTEISGGVRIEAIEPDGSKWRIEADRAVIESRARVIEEIEFASSSDVTRIVCSGSVKIEAGQGDQLTQATGEQLELDLRRNGGVLSPSLILR